MVTAELATALPALMVLVLAASMMIAVMQARLRCADAAREVARAVARGDTASADRLGRAAAGHDIDIGIRPGPSETAIAVRMNLRPLSWLGSVTITETAVVATEPTP